MNTIDLKVATDGDSPRGWQKYRLLHSPKSGLLSRSSMMTFIILFFGAGVLLGGTWNKIGTPMLPSDKATPAMSTSTTVKTHTVAKVKSYLRMKRTTVDLPLAWLMSFPNSGTSYTSYLVRTVTGKNTATNYGTENLGVDGTSVAVFKDSPDGPFWSDPLNRKYDQPNQGYLLTKTHCGGRCDQCPPKRYIENHRIFSHHCFEGYHVTKDANNTREEVLGSYSKDLVAKSVHLIRDPFDNIVSRFHLTYKRFIKKNYTEKMAMYPRSKEGFRSFCDAMADRFFDEEKDTKFYRDVLDEIANIPCHADFFRYIQWHNLAFTTAWDLQLPTLIIHYENYTDNFSQTKDMLLEFLGQDAVNEPPLFETGKTYRDYFTEEEIQAVSIMFSKLALDKTWAHMKHYFAQ